MVSRRTTIGRCPDLRSGWCLLRVIGKPNDLVPVKQSAGFPAIVRFRCPKTLRRHRQAVSHQRNGVDESGHCLRVSTRCMVERPALTAKRPPHGRAGGQQRPSFPKPLAMALLGLLSACLTVCIARAAGIQRCRIAPPTPTETTVQDSGYVSFISTCRRLLV